MLAYLTLIVTSILVGLAVVLLARPNQRFSLRAFPAGVLASVLALGSILFCQKRGRL